MPADCGHIGNNPVSLDVFFYALNNHIPHRDGFEGLGIATSSITRGDGRIRGDKRGVSRPLLSVRRLEATSYTAVSARATRSRCVMRAFPCASRDEMLSKDGDASDPGVVCGFSRYKAVRRCPCTVTDPRIARACPVAMNFLSARCPQCRSAL